REHRVHNNVFARCDKGGIVFVDENNEADGNLYASLPERFGGLGEADTLRWLDLAAWRAQGWDRHGSTDELELSLDPDRLELTIAARPGWSAVPVFNGIDGDLAGRITGARRPPGPLADPAAVRVRSVDPRVAPAHSSRRSRRRCIHVICPRRSARLPRASPPRRACCGSG